MGLVTMKPRRHRLEFGVESRLLQMIRTWRMKENGGSYLGLGLERLGYHGSLPAMEEFEAAAGLGDGE